MLILRSSRKKSIMMRPSTSVTPDPVSGTSTPKPSKLAKSDKKTLRQAEKFIKKTLDELFERFCQAAFSAGTVCGRCTASLRYAPL